MNDRVRVPNFALRRVRELERQETRSEFAEAIAEKAAELGEMVSPSERYVARLEDGDIKCPHPTYRRVLAELCGRPISELGFVVPGRAKTLAFPAESSLNARTEDGWPFTLAPSSLREIEMVRRSIDERISGNALSGMEVDDWELTAIRHGRATRYQEPSILLEDLITDLAELGHIFEYSRPTSTARRLTRVVAQMSGLVCLVLVKLDERSAFRRWARTARVAAEESGDPLMVSWILAQEAYGYYYSGDMHEAINCARYAQSASHGMPSVGFALAAALEARALASMGPEAAADAVEALRRAEEMLSKLDESDITPSAFGYSEAQLRFHEGSTYTHLRDTGAAWKAQQRALSLIPENDYTDRALTNLDRAVCLAHDGDSREAVGYASVVLSGLAEQQRRGIIDARGRDVIQAIPASDRVLPSVRQFRELLAPPTERADGE
jgi:tetratricopeptide (TPR) repeat protein